MERSTISDEDKMIYHTTALYHTEIRSNIQRPASARAPAAERESYVIFFALRNHAAEIVIVSLHAVRPSVSQYRELGKSPRAIARS